MRTPEERLQSAHLSIEGLSVGDAFGRSRGIGDGQWPYSDDTEMAAAIFAILREHQTIHQDALASAFADRFTRDPERGYGAVAYWLLFQLANGRDWRAVSREIFRGEGSLGNGGAMRAAPVGAYFSDDLGEAAHQAKLSAEVTHAHPDGQAGAIAVAVAAAYAHEHREDDRTSVAADLFEAVLAYTPEGATRDGIVQAATVPLTANPRIAAGLLGDGTLVRSSDTVPLSLWCAAAHLDSYELAVTLALRACEAHTSDRDTVCAIVGSIVALAAGDGAIPAQWRQAREPLELGWNLPT